jgi:osmotically-inducible protein OsmY
LPDPKESRVSTDADVQLEDAVIASLSQDPRIHEAGGIAVAADHGIVTLRGTVHNAADRIAAGENANKLDDVYAVDNQLKVDPLGVHRNEDHRLRAAALQALIRDEQVPSESIHVRVHDGWVWLRGNVSYQFESNAAYQDVERLDGVRGVTNEIKVNAP